MVFFPPNWHSRCERTASNEIQKNKQGFSLLEVLIALAVLAILGAVTLRGIHVSQNTLAEDRWKDTATRLGRNLLYEQKLEGKTSLAGGTFSPEHPTMHWRMESHTLEATQASRLTMLIQQQYGTQIYEVRLETFDSHWTEDPDARHSAGK